MEELWQQIGGPETHDQPQACPATLQVDMLVGDIYGNRDYSRCGSPGLAHACATVCDCPANVQTAGYLLMQQ